MLGGKIFYSLKNSPTGAIVGGVGTYLILKKRTSLPTITVVALSCVGALIGSGIESKFKANKANNQINTVVTKN